MDQRQYERARTNRKRVVAIFAAGLAAFSLFAVQRLVDRGPPAEPPSRESAVDRSAVPGEQATREGRERQRSAAREEARLAPAAAAVPQGRSIGFYAGSERKDIRIAELEQLLEASEGEFREREQDIHTELTTILKGDAVTQSMDVRCAEGFCRIKLDKPVGQGMAWHEIDTAIGPVTQGEMIFGAEPNGKARTTAYVYFARDAQLPIAAAVRPPDEE